MDNWLTNEIKIGYKRTCEIKVHKRERCYIVLTSSYIPVKYEPVRREMYKRSLYKFDHQYLYSA